MKHDNSILNGLATLDITELVFPRLCTGCSEPLLRHENHFCLICDQQLPLTRSWSTPQPGMKSLFSDRQDVGELHALFNYTKGGMVQHMLRRLKYDGAKDIGIALGEILGRFLLKHTQMDTADGLVAVPLHPAKTLRRGYNQSEMIIQGLREHLDLPDLSYCIQRTEYTDSQTSKSRYDRFQNMDHVFNCADPNLVEGKHLVLVDDVITTGSTMRSCMNVLATAGVEKFSVLTLAIA